MPDYAETLLFIVLIVGDHGFKSLEDEELFATVDMRDATHAVKDRVDLPERLTEFSELLDFRLWQLLDAGRQAATANRVDELTNCEESHCLALLGRRLLVVQDVQHRANQVRWMLAFRLKTNKAFRVGELDNVLERVRVVFK